MWIRCIFAHRIFVCKRIVGCYKHFCVDNPVVIHILDYFNDRVSCFIHIYMLVSVGLFTYSVHVMINVFHLLTFCMLISGFFC
ncbi:MAG: hypothetical protein K0R59_3114 [Sphingobacterium sp.]|jgi:hypothetical protein|nr:hypothetical protein [Sphingobacterium sp.]